MDRAHSIQETRKAYRIFVRKPEMKRHLEDISLGGKVM
jgi:hypothetical protein